jgi:hypothetical protein
MRFVRATCIQEPDNERGFGQVRAKAAACAANVQVGRCRSRIGRERVCSKVSLIHVKASGARIEVLRARKIGADFGGGGADPKVCVELSAAPSGRAESAGTAALARRRRASRLEVVVDAPQPLPRSLLPESSAGSGPSSCIGFGSSAGRHACHHLLALIGCKTLPRVPVSRTRRPETASRRARA